MSKHEKLNVKAEKIAGVIDEWIYRPEILEHFRTEICKKARELQEFDNILSKRREEKKNPNNSVKPLNELPNTPFLYYHPLGQYQLSPPIDKRKELPGFYAILSNIHDTFLPYLEPVINKNIKNIFPYIDHLTLFGPPKQVTINKPLSVKKLQTLGKDEGDRITNKISNHSLQQFNQNKSLLAELLVPQTGQIDKIKEELENHKWWDNIMDIAFRCVKGDLKNFTTDNEGQESKQEKNVRHSPAHVALLESARKADERNMSKSESINETLGRVQELARQEADKVLKDKPIKSPFDHLSRLNDYFQDAFSRVVVIAEWSRQNNPGDDLYLRGLGYFPGFAIFYEIITIKENLERAESLRKQIPNFHIIWPTDKDVIFGGCAGMSAFDVALIFSRIILNNSLAAWDAIKENHPDKDYLSLKSDPPEPLLIEWMNTAHKYLREEVLPPPEVWPRQQIRLDYNTLLSQICREGEQALKNIQVQMDNDNQKNLPEQTAASEKKPNIQKEKDIRHSHDFRSVHWYGTDYTFTSYQSACVRVLWEAMENGTPDVGAETILSEAGCESQKLKDVFKNNPAWQTMIKSGQTKGAYRLVAPPHIKNQ